jgi:hypothetical protein
VSVALAVGPSLTASVEACSTGARGTELIAVVALVAGIGAALGLLAGAELAGRSLRAGRPARGILEGAAVDLVILAVTVLVVSTSLTAIGCQRPLPS